MQLALVGVMALSAAAYAGDNHKSAKSTKQTCTTSCKKPDCKKSCPGSGAACPKDKCGMKKS